VTPAVSPWVEALGWLATATFVGSYLFGRAEVLVRVQLAGGLLWIGYGALTRAAPVVAANALVVLAAAWKCRPRRPGQTLEPGRAP
jgi:hypothetical protein